MSKLAIGSFVLALFALVASFLLQFMLGMWTNLSAVCLGLAAAAAVLGVVVDFKLYVQFFTMRTTKHGMNMGVLILGVAVLLVCLNYLANRHNKTWDVTHERLNSLSEQSAKILNGLKSDLEIKIFYRGPNANEEKTRIKSSLSLFQDASAKVKVRFVNAYVEQQEAITYMTNQPDRDSAAVMAFVDYNGKRLRIDEPYDEAAVTTTLIKATREGEAKIYFIKGHGERDLDSSGDTGMKEFAKALGDASFKSETISLMEKKEIPADASAVAVVGPALAYLDAELETLRAYLRKGGHLFLALDPGQHHNLANLTKTLGIEFENNYVVTLRPPIEGGGPATIVGVTFDPGADVTKSFPNGSSFVVFPLASSLKEAAEKPGGGTVKALVKSDASTFTITDIAKPISHQPATAPVILAMQAGGTLPQGDKPFDAIVIGDSDFLSNRGIALGLNRDLGLNSLAALAQQNDLISIKPKMPQGTALTLTGPMKLCVVAFGLAMPVVLLLTAGVMWFRRRSA